MNVEQVNAFRGRGGGGQQKGEDYYKLLNVKRGASEAEIKKKFKKQAIKFHPDKNKDDPEGAKQKFQKIANAYEVLSDPKKRQIYDEYGEEGLKNEGQGGGPGPDMDDIFNQFFGGGFGGGGRRGGGFGGGGQQFHFNFGGDPFGGGGGDPFGDMGGFGGHHQQ